mgnify:CR=1 FL=1
MRPLILIQGPVATRSGYGDHTRDIAKAIIKTYSDKYDISILSLRWGECPMNALNQDNPEDAEILKRILPQPQLPKQPDIFIQVSVPNEFQPIGKYNIGITAGVETTACSVDWINGLNRMNLIIVPSEHSKYVFKTVSFDKVDNKTKRVTDRILVNKPIEVLFEGLDKKVYHKTTEIPSTINDKLNEIPENFNYLFVGHWLQGKPGHDRKDVHTLIKTFCETFRNKQTKPGLILKTSSATFSIIDRNDMLRKIQKAKEELGSNLPNIYLIHGELTDEEMNGLYNHPKVKAHISFTKGEGFGRPLLEATASGKPVIATNFSGHIDFLKHSILLPGELKNIHKSVVWKDVLIPESQWFYVNEKYASKVMKEVFKHYKKYLPNARIQAKFTNENFGLELMNQKLEEIIDKYAPTPAEQVKLNLPKLKMANNEGPSIKLPKLKKVE